MQRPHSAGSPSMRPMPVTHALRSNAPLPPTPLQTAAPTATGLCSPFPAPHFGAWQPRKQQYPQQLVLQQQPPMDYSPIPTRAGTKHELDGTPYGYSCSNNYGYGYGSAAGLSPNPGSLSNSRLTSRSLTFGTESRACLTPTVTVATPAVGTVATAAAAAPMRAAVPALSLSASPLATGAALERQLMLGSRSELVQVLLELSSCSREAAAFIQGKAAALTLRHRAARQILRDDEDDYAEDEKENCKRSGRHGGSDGVTDAAGGDPLSSSVPNAAATPAQAKSSAAAAVAMRSFSASSHANSGADAATAGVTATPVAAAVPHRTIAPAERVFSTDMHPCLRWYGGCRNSANCIFVTLPRNLCLNWVRGACAAGSRCGGVHRLPDCCPPEVCTVRALSCGAVSRAAAMKAAAAAVAQIDLEGDSAVSPTPAAGAAVASAPSTVGLCTPAEQVLKVSATPPATPTPAGARVLTVSSSASSQPVTDYNHCDHGDDVDSSPDCDGTRTPIGPPSAVRSAAGSVVTSPFRDYFAPPRLRQRQQRQSSQQSPVMTCIAGDAQSNRESPTVTRDVQRCLNDSFVRATADTQHLRGCLPRSSAPDTQVYESIRLMRSPVRVGAEGDEELDSVAPDVGTHTRTHTPERA